MPRRKPVEKVAETTTNLLRSRVGRDYPLLDSPFPLTFRPVKGDCDTGTPRDPFECTMAKCVNRAVQLPTAVFREVSYILMEVDPKTLAWNRAHNDRAHNMSEGDLAWFRFRNPANLRREITKLDNGGTFDGAQMITLLAITPGGRITRPKASKSRRRRRDSHAEGREPVRRIAADIRRLSRLYVPPPGVGY